MEQQSYSFMFFEIQFSYQHVWEKFFSLLENSSTQPKSNLHDFVLHYEILNT